MDSTNQVSHASVLSAAAASATAFLFGARNSPRVGGGKAEEDWVGCAEEEEVLLDLKGHRHVEKSRGADVPYVIGQQDNTFTAQFDKSCEEAEKAMRYFLRRHLVHHHIRNQHGEMDLLDNLSSRHIAPLQAPLWREMPQEWGKFSILQRKYLTEGNFMAAAAVPLIADALEANSVFVVRDGPSALCTSFSCQKFHDQWDTPIRFYGVAVEPVIDWATLEPAFNEGGYDEEPLVYRRNKSMRYEFGLDIRRFIPEQCLVLCLECLHLVWEKRRLAWSIIGQFGDEFKDQLDAYRLQFSEDEVEDKSENDDSDPDSDSSGDTPLNEAMSAGQILPGRFEDEENVQGSWGLVSIWRALSIRPGNANINGQPSIQLDGTWETKRNSEPITIWEDPTTSAEEDCEGTMFDPGSRAVAPPAFTQASQHPMSANKVVRPDSTKSRGWTAINQSPTPTANGLAMRPAMHPTPGTPKKGEQLHSANTARTATMPAPPPNPTAPANSKDPKFHFDPAFAQPYPPQQVKELVSPPSPSFIQPKKRFPSASEIICACHKPAQTFQVKITQCWNPECPVGWYHYECLDKRCKLSSLHGKWLCNVCKTEKEFGGAKNTTDMSSPFSAQEIVNAMPIAGGASGGLMPVKNPYGLGADQDTSTEDREDAWSDDDEFYKN